MQDTQDAPIVQVINNEAFLKEIFGKLYNHAHTTSFKPDPFTVKRNAWSGRWFSQQFVNDANTIESWDYNNYFVISLFMQDPHDTSDYAKRQKALFEQCYLVVVDDVISKVPVEKLVELGFPQPTYRLETSPGNEQWGYVFREPVGNRQQIEYLLDSWVAQGISCDGKDPGMKGVTRYVRLPIGANTKSIYGDTPFKHVLRAWHPENRFPVERLAEMTGVDLSKAPTDDGLHAQTIIPDDEDEILIALSEAGLFQKKLKPGVFEVTCPWIDQHSERADTGAAYLQPAGFRCHHGSCQGRTGNTLRRFLLDGGWLHTMTAAEMFAGVSRVESDGTRVEGEAPVQEVAKIGNHVYVQELNRFYDVRTELYHSRDDMNARYPAGKDQPKYVQGFFEFGVQAGYNDFVTQTYHPGKPRVVVDPRGEHLNMWTPGNLSLVDGDIVPWLQLGQVLIPDEDELRHVIRWMAQTIQYPEKKINHCLLIAGAHGTGKDTFIEPLIRAVGRHNWRAVNPEEMLSDFNGYVKNKKLLVFNEIMNFSGKRELEQKLKPLLASPPDILAINQKYMPVLELPNIVNSIMFSNEGHQAVAVSQGDRRYFCIDSPATVMGDEDAIAIWNWYLNEQGIEKVYSYLLGIDVSDFNPKAPPPMTEFKQELIEASKPGLDTQVAELFEGSPGEWEVFHMSRLIMALSLPNEPGWPKKLGATLRRLDYKAKSLRDGNKMVRTWTPKEFFGKLNIDHYRKGRVTR